MTDEHLQRSKNLLPGLTLQAHWEEYSRALPPDFPEEARSQLRRVFYGGALAYMRCLAGERSQLLDEVRAELGVDIDADPS